MTKRSAEVKLFIIALCSFAGMSLIVLWGERFPPMQDYPTHLMIAKILATANDAAYDWSKYYTINHSFSPYHFVYYFVATLSHYFGIESAGKIGISLYFVLVALFAWHYARDQIVNGHIPWLLLLIFPLSFNQIYYLGFLNYLISVPVLLWILYEYKRLIGEPRNLWRLAAQIISPLLLFFIHPFSFLVYVVITLSGTMFQWLRGRREIRLAQWIPLGWAILFCIWYLTINFGGERSSGPLNDYYSWPLLGLVYNLLLPMVGQTFTLEHGLWSTLSWAVILIISVRNPITEVTQNDFTRSLLLLLAGYVILPFHLSGYSYFNLRLVLPIYLLLAVVMSHKKIERRYVVPLLLAISCLFIDIRSVHRGVSQETAQLLPLFAQMPPNARILPLYDNAESKYLDHTLYYEMSVHTHDYYHILVGGGVTPDLFYNELLPVHLREDLSIPRVPILRIDESMLQEMGSYYDYALVRGRGRHVFPASWSLLSKSGEWRLYHIATKAAGAGSQD